MSDELLPWLTPEEREEFFRSPAMRELEEKLRRYVLPGILKQLEVDMADLPDTTPTTEWAL